MKVYTYPYDTSYSPPMPVVEVGLGRPGSRKEEAIVAIIDSGADGTLIPIDLLEQVEARYVGDARLRGISGASQAASVYLASLHIGSETLSIVRVLATPEGSEPILGRNVLQYLVVTLNGPAGVSEIAG
jgi:predicted aspartyl protease